MLNELEYSKLIQLFEDKVERNPKGIETLELLRSLKEKKKYISSNEERKKAKEFIDVFYRIGIYSTDDPSKITKSEIEKSVEYIVLAKRYKKLDKEIEKVIRDMDSLSTEDFKFLIHKYTQEMLEIGLSLGEFI